MMIYASLAEKLLSVHYLHDDYVRITEVPSLGTTILYLLVSIFIIMHDDYYSFLNSFIPVCTPLNLIINTWID